MFLIEARGERSETEPLRQRLPSPARPQLHDMGLSTTFIGKSTGRDGFSHQEAVYRASVRGHLPGSFMKLRLACGSEAAHCRRWSSRLRC